MSKQPEHEGAQRFGGEFGPKRGENTTGVSLSTFNFGLKHRRSAFVVFALEFLFVQQEFAMGLGFLIAGVIVALFPSNYEIRGMEEEESS